MKNLVSVIIPTYNRANKIVLAIKSALRQSYSNLEIIIVDDNSADNTESIVTEYQNNHSNVRYIKNEINLGASLARNKGISFAKGEFVAFLDSDDEWLDNKIEEQVKMFLAGDANLGVVYTGFEYVRGSRKFRSQYIPTHKGWIFPVLLTYNCIGALSNVMVKKKILDEIGGFDAVLPGCEDWDLFIRLSKICQFDFVGKVLMRYSEEFDSVRISNSSKAVMSGQDLMAEKYKEDVNKLSLTFLAQRDYYYGRTLVSYRFFIKSVKFFIVASVKAKSSLYLFLGMRYIVRFQYERLLQLFERKVNRK